MPLAMNIRDFSILMICCLFFGGNFVMASWAVGGHGVPPFMMASFRAAFVLLLMAGYLFKTRPEKFTRLLWVCLCVGPMHLGFLYTGLKTAPASGSSIVSQMLIPFATILSVIFLKERIGWVRALGITGALIGTIVMIYEPEALNFDFGLIYIILAYLALAVGSIIMKTVGEVDWQVYVAWMALTVLIFAVPISLVTEPAWSDVWTTAKWPLIVTAVYAAIGVTIIAHGQYFRVIRLYDVSLVVPLTLMVPVFATVLGVWLLGEQITSQIMIGAGLILPCVYIIAKRQTQAGADYEQFRE